MKTYLLGAYYIGLTVFVFMGVPYLCFRLYKRYESRPVLARWLYTLMPVLILVSLSWVLRFAGYNNGGVQTLPEARPEPKGTETLPSTAPTPQPTAPRPEQPSPPAPKPARPAPKPAAPAPAPPVVSVAPAPPILPQQPHEHPSQIRRFPWPPPAPSAMVQLPIETFRSRSTYGQLAEELDLALNANGYIERSYYGVGDASDNADGFVVVTRMERIYRNGQSFKGPDRWILGDPSLNTISAYLARIANTDEGYFRVVAFVFTNQPFRTDLKDVVTANAATDWLYDGMTSLPSEVAGRSTPPSTECTALIYEFRKEHGSPPDYDIPSLVGAQQHLTGSGILAALSLVPGGSK